MHAHLARNICKHYVSVFQFYFEHRIRKRLDNRSFEFYSFLFCQILCSFVIASKKAQPLMIPQLTYQRQVGIF